jgi:hypothetical protein
MITGGIDGNDNSRSMISADLEARAVGGAAARRRPADHLRFSTLGPIRGWRGPIELNLVELLDLQAHSPGGRLPLEALDLAADLHRGDHVKALLRQAHGGFMAEAGSRARDEDLLKC